MKSVALKDSIKITIKPAFFLGEIVLLVCIALGAGYFIQHALGVEPCPLCIVQRFAFLGVGLAALLAVLLQRRHVAFYFFSVLSVLGALAGAGVAGWHLWIKSHPPESFSCGRPFAWMIENMPLTQSLPKLFRGEADCLQDQWTFWGLGIPHWSLLLFVLMVILGVLGIYALRRTTQGIRATGSDD